MRINKCFIFAAMLALSAAAGAADLKLGDLTVKQPYARATMPQQPSGAVYFSVENIGLQGDKLVAVSTSAAQGAALHSMTMDGNVMKMREVDAIEIAPGATLEMKPGHGYHVMLTGLKKQLKRGDKFTLTLTFAKAGKLDVPVEVGDGGAASAPHHH